MVWCVKHCICQWLGVLNIASASGLVCKALHLPVVWCVTASATCQRFCVLRTAPASILVCYCICQWFCALLHLPVVLCVTVLPHLPVVLSVSALLHLPVALCVSASASDCVCYCFESCTDVSLLTVTVMSHVLY